jgi:hypothetical protein
LSGWLEASDDPNKTETVVSAGFFIHAGCASIVQDAAARARTVAVIQ